MNVTLQFNVGVMQDDNVAIAQLHTGGDDHTDIVGSAKRHPDDKPEPMIGHVLALGRMFRQLAEHYDEVADELIEVSATEQREEEAEVPDTYTAPGIADFYAQYGVPSEEMDE